MWLAYLGLGIASIIVLMFIIAWLIERNLAPKP